jgi:hypothetical protein
MAVDRGNNTLLWVGGGTVAAILLWRKVISPRIVQHKQLIQYSQRIRVTMPGMRFKGDNVEFDLYIQNPNPNPMTVQAIVGDLYILDPGRNVSYKLGNIFRYGAVTIQPLAETKYQLQVRTKFIQMLAYFNDLLAGKFRGQLLQFKGTITINGRPWPITEQTRIV